MPRRAPLAALLSLTLLACAPRVQRFRDGQSVAGRAVPASAYAHYLRGLLALSKPDESAARAAFLRVIQLDPQAAEAWIQLGMLDCRGVPEAAERAFAKAQELAPDAAALWSTRSRCAGLQGQTEPALRYARLAFEYAPLAPESSELLARAELASGDRTRALQLTWGLASYGPDSPRGWTLLAQVSSDPAQQRFALLRLAGSQRLKQAALPRPGWTSTRRSPVEQLALETAARDALDHSLAYDHPDFSRQAADALGLAPLELGWLALDRAAPKTALREAERLVYLEVGLPDSRVLALCAAELAGDREAFERLLAQPLPPNLQTPLSARARAALDALLTRHGLAQAH